MRKLSDSNYINIHGSMVNAGLQGTELIIFAIVYGFSQDGRNKCDASLEYFEAWTGKSRRTVINSIDKLVKRGLLRKIVRNGTSNILEYNSEMFITGAKTAPLEKEPVQKLHGGGAKTARTGAKTAPNNKYNKYIINNDAAPNWTARDVNDGNSGLEVLRQNLINRGIIKRRNVKKSDPEINIEPIPF